MRVLIWTLAAVAIGNSYLHAAEEAPPIEITLHPAAVPQPAMRYQLLPDFAERFPGNAAVYYGKVKAERTAFFAKKDLADNIDRWQEASLDDIRRERPELPFSRYYLDQAARCSMCDWQLPIGREPYASIMLPEAQEMRQFARILGAQARIEMASGNLDAAINICQTKFAMGRNVAAAPTFVNALIGLAICERGFSDLREMMQIPEAPNLYWALSTLPQPLVDFRPGLEVERRFLNLTLRDKIDVDATTLSADQWRQRLSDVIGEIQQVMQDSEKPPVAVDVDEAVKRLLPIARQSLLDSGRTEASLAAMADAQIVLADWLQRYYQHSDECYCAWQLDYRTAMTRFDEIDGRANAGWAQQRDLLPLHQLTPGFRSTRRAFARLERSLAVQRVFESLRIYAAGHEGKLPERLSDVSEVPVPLDPVTGEPFAYEVKDGIAMLRGPDLPDAPLHYEISMDGNAATPIKP